MDADLYMLLALMPVIFSIVYALNFLWGDS